MDMYPKINKFRQIYFKDTISKKNRFDSIDDVQTPPDFQFPDSPPKNQQFLKFQSNFYIQ
jgi:hypothetical protein